MKKFLLIILVIMIATLLCACNDKKGGENSSSGEHSSEDNSQIETNESIESTKKENFYEKMVDTLEIGRPLSKEEVISLYGLDENYANSAYCMINKKEASYDEVFVTEGTEDNKELLGKLASRVEAIRRDPNNEDVKDIIKDAKNVCLKEFNGFVILIVSNRANELKDKLDNYILDNIEK